jgi:hypothetical protein
MRFVRWGLLLCAIPIAALCIPSAASAAALGGGIATFTYSGFAPNEGSVSMTLDGVIVAGTPYVGSISTSGWEYGGQYITGNGCTTNVPPNPNVNPGCYLDFSGGPISGSSGSGRISGNCGSGNVTELSLVGPDTLTLVCSISVNGGAPQKTTFTIIGVGVAFPQVGVFLAN